MTIKKRTNHKTRHTFYSLGTDSWTKMIEIFKFPGVKIHFTISHEKKIKTEEFHSWRFLFDTLWTNNAMKFVDLEGKPPSPATKFSRFHAIFRKVWINCILVSPHTITHWLAIILNNTQKTQTEDILIFYNWNSQPHFFVKLASIILHTWPTETSNNSAIEDSNSISVFLCTLVTGKHWQRGV